MNPLDLGSPFRRTTLLAAAALWAIASPFAWGRVVHPHRPAHHASRHLTHRVSHGAAKAVAHKHAGPKAHRSRRVVAATPAEPRRGRAKQAVTRAHHKVMVQAKPLIVIDPGHGGKDPGTIGLFHIEEKDVVLRTALTLRRLLEATGQYRVAMTRTTDVFIPLADRLRFAREHHAALFISIHANFAPDPAVHGACVYVRTPGAEGDTITQVAGGPSAGSDIASALDPRTHAGSAWLQSHLIDQLQDDIPVTAAPAREGHLYVLGSHSIPSVLLEMGFLSNRQDAIHLRQVHYRLTIAEAIRDAIGDYFAELKHPPALPT